jgi:hypothetical protein
MLDINTLNYIKYIKSNKEILDIILNNCTIDIIQEYETEEKCKFNPYTLGHYNINQERFFNHVINIELNNKSIKVFNDIINNNKHNELIKAINNIISNNDLDRLIDAIK